MTKSEKLFDLLRYVQEYPSLTAGELSKLCDVSERGVYRYINTLANSGIPIRFDGQGYRLLDDSYDLFREIDLDSLRAARYLISKGMKYCEDDNIKNYGEKLLKLIDQNIPSEKFFGMIRILSKGAKAKNRGGELIIGHSSKPSIINPILTSDTISATIMNLLYSSLLDTDGLDKPVGDACKEWKVSKDGLRWTFYLRDDVYFHDGHPLTSHDVEFTFRSIMDPANKSQLLERYVLIDRMETPDKYTFIIHLKYPFAPLAHRLDWPIAPKHLLEGEDFWKTPYNHYPIGSGPFKFSGWDKDDTITLEANRDYYEPGRPILDNLEFKHYPDRKEAVNSIRKGDIDIALDLAAPDLLFLNSKGKFRVYSSSGEAYYALFLNTRDPMLRDLRVRIALDYAIDRESIINTQLKGHGDICTGPFSLDSWAYNNSVQPTPYKLENARRLIEQTGWEYDYNDGFLKKNGKLFELSVNVTTSSDIMQRIAIAIKAQLMKLGVKVDIIYTEYTELQKTDCQCSLFKIPFGADPDYAYRIWYSDSQLNVTSYNNSQVDKYFDEARSEVDLEKRKEKYQKIHEIIHDDYPAIFLFTGNEFISSNYILDKTYISSILSFLTASKDWEIITNDEEIDSVSDEKQKVRVVF
ncbi:HTH domain-containing protein [Candidatus Poribacteria bacterium]|nr:HTH domain-containing protein [Candidatus Poribacteria bacterium]